MAKYTSTEVVNACQWTPADTTAMQEFLADYRTKVKEVKILQTVKATKLATAGCLDVSTPNLIISPTSGSDVSVAANSYLIRTTSGFKAMSATNFEQQYKLLEDGTVEPIDPENPGQDPDEGDGDDDNQEPVTPSWSTGSLAQTKTALRSQLMAGNNVLNNTLVSTDGTDVLTTQQWYTQSAKEALQQAVNLANSVNDDTQATQDEVDGATQILKDAVIAAKAARQNGTKEAE